MVPCPQRQHMSQDSGGLAFSTPLSPAPLSPVPLGPRRLSHSSQTLGQQHWGKSDFLPVCVLSRFLKYLRMNSLLLIVSFSPTPVPPPSLSLLGWEPSFPTRTQKPGKERLKLRARRKSLRGGGEGTGWAPGPFLIPRSGKKKTSG